MQRGQTTVAAASQITQRGVKRLCRNGVIAVILFKE
jgi:hypothetical protein